MFFSQEKMRWEAGKICIFESLSEMTKSMYNNIVMNNKWDAVDPKDAQIMALTTKVHELVSGNTAKAGGRFSQWRNNNVGPMITRDGKSWWWCPHHGENGMYVRHKPEDHGIFKKGNRRTKKDREEATSKQQAGKENKKLILSEKMKAALVTVGLFSDEQAEAIINETRANLPEDF